ncbi:tyrosine-type recombinase/integrase [uncultured Helicobacter sp.]|uniref:tyrosine-type recombinase/integrase n=1 Tax=uncultured Helicobacter sp. TaxID=175537 RepID=UPI00374F110A
MGINKTSQRYEGVRSKKLNNGDIAYYVRWRNENGERFERKVGTKSEGWNEKKASLKKIELQSTKVANNKATIQEVAQRYLTLQKLHIKPSSIPNYTARVNHIIAAFGTQYVNAISTKDINSFIATLSERFANKTINTIICTLGAILNLAQKEYEITNNVMQNIKNLKVDNARERFLSVNEIAELRARLQGYSEVLLFVTLSLSTGARLMSVLDIRKQDINLQNRIITIRDFKNSSNYQGFLDNYAYTLLQERLPSLNPSDRVIRKSKRTIVETLRPILNEMFNAGIKDNKQKVVIHTLRHTFASHLAIKGTPIQIIQKLLNHKDIQMTMRYAHLLPSSGKEWVERLWE